MSLLDELRGMYGQEPNRIQEMLDTPPPPVMDQGAPGMQPAGLDPSTMSATSSDMSQPSAGGAQQYAGHPDVLSFIKELGDSGQLTGNDNAAKGPKGLVNSSTTIKSEQGGVPSSVEAEGVAQRGQEGLDNGMVDVARQHKAADELEQRAAIMRQDAQVRQLELADQQKQIAAKQERMRSQQMELANQADEPVNPDRYFQNMGAFAKATSIISAGIYGYLGGKGTPPIADLLMQKAKEDTAAQMANNSAARGRRSALIEQYERQYGDTTLVAKRLEADKLLELSKVAKAEAMNAQSTEVRAAAEDLQSKLENHVGVLHNDIQKATFGKPVEVSSTFTAPKPKGGTEEMMKGLKLREEMEKGGYSQEAISAELTKRKLPVPNGSSEYRADQVRKGDSEERDQQKLAIERDKLELERGKGKEINPAEKQKLIEKVDGLAMADNGFRELDAIGGLHREKVSGEVTRGGTDDKTLDEAILPKSQAFADAALRSLPWKAGDKMANFAGASDPQRVQALRRAAEKITTGMAHAESGAGINEGELDAAKSRLPITNADSLKKASAELWRERKQKYNNLKGQYGKDVIDEMLRKRGIDPASLGASDLDE